MTLLVRGTGEIALAAAQVTVGEEGFFGPNDPHVNCNPSYPDSWPSYEGQDFTNNHRSKDIDFTVRSY